MSYDTKHVDALPDTKYIGTHHTESGFPEERKASEQLEKTATAGTANDDVAFRVFTNVHALADDIDQRAEKRLVRKIDFYVIPFICITYLITYIDKATLSYDRVELFHVYDLALTHSSRSLRTSKGPPSSWHPIQLAWLHLLLRLLFEYPTSFAMQRLSVAKWLSGNIFVWGGICMALGGCNGFSSLAALRFILGMLESCSTPAYLLLTAMWYKVEEQPIRIGYWSVFLGLANAFGGLLAYDIGHIHGGLAPWRYQFIIVGSFSAAWGVIMYITLAENPSSARWLSTEEKKLDVERLRDNNTGIKNTHFKRYQLIEAFVDPKTWFLFLFGMSTQVVNGSVSNFGSLIIKGFGYSKLVTTLLQIPYGFIICFSVLSAMYLQKYIKGQQRCHVAVLYVLPALAGVVGIHVLPETSQHSLLGCYCLTAFYTAPFAMCMSLITANVAGSTKRTTVNAIFFISYCVGNIVGPFAFKSCEAPRYPSGIIAIMVAYCVEIVVLLLFSRYLSWCNRVKARDLVEKGLGTTSEEERAFMGFRDLTDVENPFFRYTY